LWRYEITDVTEVNKHISVIEVTNPNISAMIRFSYNWETLLYDFSMPEIRALVEILGEQIDDCRAFFLNEKIAELSKARLPTWLEKLLLFRHTIYGVAEINKKKSVIFVRGPKGRTILKLTGLGVYFYELDDFVLNELTEVLSEKLDD